MLLNVTEYQSHSLLDPSASLVCFVGWLLLWSTAAAVWNPVSARDPLNCGVPNDIRQSCRISGILSAACVLRSNIDEILKLTFCLFGSTRPFHTANGTWAKLTTRLSLSFWPLFGLLFKKLKSMEKFRICRFPNPIMFVQSLLLVWQRSALFQSLKEFSWNTFWFCENVHAYFTP